MNVKVSEIKAVINLLLDYVAQQSGGIVDIEPDTYWFVAKESVYNPYAESPELTLGQLTDDWQHLKNILDKKDDPVGYALVWASCLLRAIGDEVP